MMKTAQIYMPAILQCMNGIYNPVYNNQIGVLLSIEAAFNLRMCM